MGDGRHLNQIHHEPATLFAEKNKNNQTNDERRRRRRKFVQRIPRHRGTSFSSECGMWKDSAGQKEDEKQVDGGWITAAAVRPFFFSFNYNQWILLVVMATSRQRKHTRCASPPSWWLSTSQQFITPFENQHTKCVYIYTYISIFIYIYIYNSVSVKEEEEKRGLFAL